MCTPKADPKGLEFILRADAVAKSYLHRISEYYYFYSEDSLHMGWQLQMVSTTEVPFMNSPKPFTLAIPNQLRTTPKLQNEPPVNYNQDDKYDGAGNIVAVLESGLHGFKLAEKLVEGNLWSFVILTDTPRGKHIFQTHFQGKHGLRRLDFGTGEGREVAAALFSSNSLSNSN